jgi:hypothetical protein
MAAGAVRKTMIIFTVTPFPSRLLRLDKSPRSYSYIVTISVIGVKENRNQTGYTFFPGVPAWEVP